MAKKHYIDNQRFTREVIAHNEACKLAEAEGKPIPRVSDYIGECLFKIAEGITRTPKFARRTYKEELVMDAVENCLKFIRNFSPEAVTRSGNPNAFGYFSRITYFAFLRRVEEENKTYRKHLNYMRASAIESFMTEEDTSMLAAMDILDTVTSPYEEYDEKANYEKKAAAKKKAKAKVK
jgi:hypothetical protein